jgi:hypothetical protein
MMNCVGFAKSVNCLSYATFILYLTGSRQMTFLGQHYMCIFVDNDNSHSTDSLQGQFMQPADFYENIEMTVFHSKACFCMLKWQAQIMPGFHK